jgi:hypothetical protein
MQLAVTFYPCLQTYDGLIRFLSETGPFPNKKRSWEQTKDQQTLTISFNELETPTFLQLPQLFRLPIQAYWVLHYVVKRYWELGSFHRKGLRIWQNNKLNTTYSNLHIIKRFLSINLPQLNKSFFFFRASYPESREFDYLSDYFLTIEKLSSDWQVV